MPNLNKFHKKKSQENHFPYDRIFSDFPARVNEPGWLWPSVPRAQFETLPSTDPVLGIGEVTAGMAATRGGSCTLATQIQLETFAPNPWRIMGVGEIFHQQNTHNF